MTIGILMALYHYPNNVLENGTGVWPYAPLELGVDFLQPAFMVLAMTQLPFDLAWWGNTTLGCYCFHFYFKDTMTSTFQLIADGLAWDSSGILVIVALVG